MFIYGFLGFIIGFGIGVLVNVYLLQGVPVSERLNNKKLRLTYGLLNWGIAFFGMVIGLALAGL